MILADGARLVPTSGLRRRSSGNSRLSTFAHYPHVVVSGHDPKCYVVPGQYVYVIWWHGAITDDTQTGVEPIAVNTAPSPLSGQLPYWRTRVLCSLPMSGILDLPGRAGLAVRIFAKSHRVVTAFRFPERQEIVGLQHVQ